MAFTELQALISTSCGRVSRCGTSLVPYVTAVSVCMCLYVTGQINACLQPASAPAAATAASSSSSPAPTPAALARHLSHDSSNCVSVCLCLCVITALVLPFHYFTATRMLLLDGERWALQATAKSTISFFSIRLSAYVTLQAGRQATVTLCGLVCWCQWMIANGPGSGSLHTHRVKVCSVVHTLWRRQVILVGDVNTTHTL